MQVPQKPINIDEIPPVGGDYYENILNVYQTQDESNYYYYNISKKIVVDINDVDETYIEYYYIDRPMPLTTMSFKLFGTMHLWWLIAAMNQLNAVEVPPANIVVAVPKRAYLQNILNGLKK
jgi:hypothetical protein